MGLVVLALQRDHRRFEIEVHVASHVASVHVDWIVTVYSRLRTIHSTRTKQSRSGRVEEVCI
eukprot:COSAG05_NODE_13531_length_426_cov_1.269113_1_plen_61_part_10